MPLPRASIFHHTAVQLGIKAAKLFTVERMRFTAVDIRALNKAFEMCADCSSVGRF